MAIRHSVSENIQKSWYLKGTPCLNSIIFKILLLVLFASDIKWKKLNARYSTDPYSLNGEYLRNKDSFFELGEQIRSGVIKSIKARMALLWWIWSQT